MKQLFIYGTTVFAVLLTITSCTPKSSPQRSQTHYGSSSGNQNKQDIVATVVDVPDSDKDERSWKEKVDAAQEAEEYAMLEKNDNMVTGEIVDEFDDSEIQHVTNKSYDPFKDNSYIYINMDQLRDEFCYPYQGKLISNYGMRSGRMHWGVDLKAIPRDTICAALDGIVRLSKPYSGYGNVVVIRHDNGLETVYSHAYRNLVKANQKVRAGEPIALAGRTGRASTEHLHFEVRVQGQCFDPNKLIDVENFTLKKGELYIYKSNGKVYATTNYGAAKNKNTSSSESLSSNVKSSSSSSSSSVKKDDEEGVKSEKKEQQKNPVYHTIKSGDTLSAIARKYGTSVASICKLNNISENKVLKLNSKLRVK